MAGLDPLSPLHQGFLTDALDEARQVIRGFTANLPPLPNLPDPLSAGAQFAQPFAHNPFIASLTPLPLAGPNGQSPFASRPITAPGFRATPPSTSPAPPRAPGAPGPIARAMQAASAPPSGADGSVQHSAQYRSVFQQIGKEEGVPWEYLAAPPPGVKPLAGITIYQYGQESLDTGAADYICGPIAAKAFLASQGREPTLREALDLARGQGLIDPSNGMHGIESTAQLIRKLGGVATVGTPDASRMAQEIAAGRPVIVDTNAGSRGHYFVAEGYDPQTGRFDFGNSARALRASGGRTQYTLEELASLGFGSVHGAIYAH
jgi:hypothetical protein